MVCWNGTDNLLYAVALITIHVTVLPYGMEQITHVLPEALVATPSGRAVELVNDGDTPPTNPYLKHRPRVSSEAELTA